MLVSAVTAQEQFDAAEHAYDLGQFDRARRLYTEAYELDPRPGLLFNIGQCHKKLGDWSQAAFFYRRYLARTPKGEGVEKLQELITEMDAKAAALAQQRPQPPPAPVPAPTTPSTVKKAALSLEPSPAPPRPPTFATPTVEAALADKPLYREWWVWAAAGTATTATLAGVVAASVAASQQRLPRYGELDAR
ncbi:MAG: tetratricopeptide repeat protein [Myxococcaceae bacterium]|nr:tetratricopeptide repeat protein [Myxococcaceae bacterium]